MKPTMDQIVKAVAILGATKAQTKLYTSMKLTDAYAQGAKVYGREIFRSALEAAGCKNPRQPGGSCTRCGAETLRVYFKLCRDCYTADPTPVAPTVAPKPARKASRKVATPQASAPAPEDLQAIIAAAVATAVAQALAQVAKRA